MMDINTETIGAKMPNRHDGTSYLISILAVVLSVLLAAVGFLNYVLHEQTSTKLDRITGLFIHERDIINQDLKEICNQLGITKVDIEKLKMYHINGNGNGAKK